mmetsp:Transcript_75362/g.133033  ORF Transcript_75362/g.133033 Transcript_75362/m.133033 type:complete len:93 (-) Transcript_75362:251-529(-)
MFNLKDAALLKAVLSSQKLCAARHEVPKVIEDLKRHHPAAEHTLKDFLADGQASHYLRAWERAVQEQANGPIWTSVINVPGNHDELVIVDPN